MKTILILFLSFCPILTFGQIKSYQNLLDSVSTGLGGLIICSKPIRTNELHKKDMFDYFQYFDFRQKTKNSKSLDTVMFAQIIENSKIIDSTAWKESEFPKLLLVRNENDFVSKKYFKNKILLADKQEIKRYKRQIREFNNREAFDRNLYHLSRPIFDNSKTYAIIQSDNAHSGLGGRGGINLFHWENGYWKEIGTITDWIY